MQLIIICLLLLSLIALILVLCKLEQVARMRDNRRWEQLQPLPQVPKQRSTSNGLVRSTPEQLQPLPQVPKQPQLSDPRIVAHIRTQRIWLPPELRQAVLQGMQKGK